MARRTDPAAHPVCGRADAAAEPAEQRAGAPQARRAHEASAQCCGALERARLDAVGEPRGELRADGGVRRGEELGGIARAELGEPLLIRRTHGARVDDRVQQDREALERRRRDVEAVGVPAPGGKYERAREIDETVVDDVGPEVEDQRVLARRADEVVRDVRAALPAHREREAEVGREPADDPVRQREVVGVHDEVDVLAEVLRPALVVAEHGVADALLVVGGEQRAEEAARERAVPAGEGVGAGGGRHARWRHRILLTASTTSWRF